MSVHDCEHFGGCNDEGVQLCDFGKNLWCVFTAFGQSRCSDYRKSWTIKGYCSKCHQAWVVHDGDGSCIID